MPAVAGVPAHFPNQAHLEPAAVTGMDGWSVWTADWADDGDGWLDSWGTEGARGG